MEAIHLPGVGISTSFFASAAGSPFGEKGGRSQRAQEIAEQSRRVGDAADRRVEAVKGYLNLYFATRNMPPRGRNCFG